MKPEVVLLDVGMATELTGDDRNNMLALFQAFSKMDGAAMADATLRFAGKAQRCLNPDGFKKAIAECASSASVACTERPHTLVFGLPHVRAQAHRRTSLQECGRFEGRFVE